MSQAIDREHGLELLRQMLLIRRFEEKCAELYTLEKIRGFLHLCIGEEAVAVGCMAALDPGDAVVSTYREHGHALAKGCSPSAVMAEMFGKVTGSSRGRGGSMHIFDVEKGLYGGHAIVGAGLPAAVGMALADEMQKRAAITVCFFGDGAVDEGEFHESLNLAALWRLPVLFVCENNRYAMGTAIERHLSVTDICAKPRAYGIPAEYVDGMDVLAVEAAAKHAVSEVRRTRSPFFLEARTYRFRAHSMYDAELYRDKEEVRMWARERDPIPRLKGTLREAGWLTDELEKELDAEIDAAVALAVDDADRAPLEPESDLTRHVYAEG